MPFDHCAAVLSCLVLVIPAAGESIVSYKQKVAGNRKPVWQRYYIDFILLIFSIRLPGTEQRLPHRAEQCRSQLMLTHSLYYPCIIYSYRFTVFTDYPHHPAGFDTDRYIAGSGSLGFDEAVFRNSTQYLLYFIIMTVS